MMEKDKYVIGKKLENVRCIMFIFFNIIIFCFDAITVI